MQETGILFSEDYSGTEPERMEEILAERVKSARIPRMIVTMGGKGAVYADQNGEHGVHPAMKVDVVDTTGAGDAFFAGACAGLTYGKTLKEACGIGTRLSSTVICTSENIVRDLCRKSLALFYKKREDDCRINVVTGPDNPGRQMNPADRL